MKNLSSDAIIKVVFKTLIILIITKLISLVVMFFLPDSGVTKPKTYSKIPNYARYSVKTMVTPAKIKKAVVQTQTTSSSSAPVSQISNMLLKGLYGNGKNSIAIVAMKSKPKATSVVSIGEIYGGYRLKKVTQNSAIFSRGGKDFTLLIKEDKTKKSLREITKGQAPAFVETTNHAVSKADINHYAKHYKDIWKDIGIVESKKNGKLQGFKVTRIRTGSPFAQLGLKKGDLIIKANNKKINSYADAIDIYKHIDKLNAVEIVVIRNGSEKELYYDIY